MAGASAGSHTWLSGPATSCSPSGRGCRVRWDRRQPAAVDRRPRRPHAVLEHAADVQDHLADERRLVILSGSGTATGIAAANTFTGLFRRSSRQCQARGCAVRAAARDLHRRADREHLGARWHEARLSLPALFAGGAAASAGAAATLLTPPAHAAPARRLAVMRRCGARRRDRHGAQARLAGRALPRGNQRQAGARRKALTLPSGHDRRVGRPPRSAAVLGATALLAGAVTERFAVFRAGFASAKDPKFTVGRSARASPRCRPYRRGERRRRLLLCGGAGRSARSPARALRVGGCH